MMMSVISNFISRWVRFTTLWSPRIRNPSAATAKHAQKGCLEVFILGQFLAYTLAFRLVPSGMYADQIQPRSRLRRRQAPFFSRIRLILPAIMYLLFSLYLLLGTGVLEGRSPLLNLGCYPGAEAPR